MIGAGIASLSAIKAIREHDTHTPIVLISDEDRLPYKRTQINKLMLNGFSSDEIAIHTANYYRTNNITLLFGQASKLDTIHQTVNLTDNRVVPYQKCLLAMGHQHRTYSHPLIPPDKIFTVYTAAQSETLQQHAQSHQSYFVLGGGVEGVEIAEQLTKMGKAVYLIQRPNGLLQNLFSKAVSAKIKNTLANHHIHHIEHGDHELEFQFANNRIELASQGKIFVADGIVSCIGSAPRIALAQNAFLDTDNGILVNNHFATSATNVFAAGNVAQLPQHVHCHLWHQAESQGYCAGLNIIGLSCTYQHKPYRLKTELFDHFFYSHNYENTTPEMKKIVEEKDSIYRELFFDNNRLIALLMVNDKPRAKTYQEALWNNWTYEDIKQKLPI